MTIPNHHTTPQKLHKSDDTFNLANPFFFIQNVNCRHGTALVDPSMNINTLKSNNNCKKDMFHAIRHLSHMELAPKFYRPIDTQW